MQENDQNLFATTLHCYKYTSAYETLHCNADTFTLSTHEHSESNRSYSSYYKFKKKKKKKSAFIH